MKLHIIALTLLAMGLSTLAKAQIIPVGVQQNVSMSTVTGAWGWTLAYEDTYADPSVSIATMFANVPTGDYVMLAAAPVGSTTFTLLSAALKSDVQTYTPLNSPHVANGSEWYYNGYSLGFAGLGDSIFQVNADINSGATHLSWHTGVSAGRFSSFDSTVVPTYVYSGYRAGDTLSLNNSTDWNRFVLYAPANLEAAPEPSTWALMLGGLGALAFFYRRGQQNS